MRTAGQAAHSQNVGRLNDNSGGIMRKSTILYVIIIIMTQLISCGSVKLYSNTFTTTPTLIFTPTDAPKYIPISTSTIIPTLTPTITYTNTKNPILPTVTNWEQYSFIDIQESLNHPLDQVSIIIDIPKGWEVQVGANRYPITIIHPNYYAVLEISNISSSVEFNNPYSNVPNEGGMKVMWSRQITMPDIIGLEYLWGKNEEQSNELYGFLSVNLFSKKYSRSIYILDGVFKGKTIDEFAKIYSIKYSIFEHIYKSLRISYL
jgi:hypothetical protein